MAVRTKRAREPVDPAELAVAVSEHLAGLRRVLELVRSEAQDSGLRERDRHAYDVAARRLSGSLTSVQYAGELLGRIRED